MAWEKKSTGPDPVRLAIDATTTYTRSECLCAFKHGRGFISVEQKQKKEKEQQTKQTNKGNLPYEKRGEERRGSREGAVLGQSLGFQSDAHLRHQTARAHNNHTKP